MSKKKKKHKLNNNTIKLSENKNSSVSEKPAATNLLRNKTATAPRNNKVINLIPKEKATNVPVEDTEMCEEFHSVLTNIPKEISFHEAIYTICSSNEMFNNSKKSKFYIEEEIYKFNIEKNALFNDFVKKYVDDKSASYKIDSDFFSLLSKVDDFRKAERKVIFRHMHACMHDF